MLYEKIRTRLARGVCILLAVFLCCPLSLQAAGTEKENEDPAQEDSYYIQTGITVNALDRILYLETLKDVSEVFRARQISNDELGQLTTDFNHMANVLEENINKLEEEIQAREDFMAAFAHELKTPLTAIIGYADMLRSRKLDEEKSFLSANYIYGGKAAGGHVPAASGYHCHQEGGSAVPAGACRFPFRLSEGYVCFPYGDGISFSV